jgi:hypothetical protein
MWAGHTRLQNHVGIERMIENLNWNGATGWEVSTCLCITFVTFWRESLGRPDTHRPLLTTRHRTRLWRTGSSMAGRRELGRRRAI